MLSRLKKEPLIKFLIISVLIYVTYSFYGRRDAETLAKENTITITANEIAIMEFGWQQRYNRNPTDVELQRLIDTRIKESVLYEEAKKMGLDKDDVVLKRRVVLQFRNLIEGLISAPEPSNEVLATYFQENIEAYMPDERISITQLFFDPDKREETTLEDAKKALEKLQKMKTFPSDIRNYGDNFMLANTYTDITVFQLRKYFGRGFTKSIMEIEPHVWVGPILSGYGTHLVYISEKNVAEPPALEEVRERVLTDYLEAEKKELIQLFMDDLIDKYEVVIVEETTVN